MIGILGIEVKGAALCYAGDDESDVSAMEFIIDHAGKVISVGQQALVEGSLVARDQRELCREIRQLAGLPPARRIREVNRS